MKELEKLIAPALKAVEDHLADTATKTKVAKEYDGYAASFGASVRTAGLLTTLAFYSNQKKGERGKLLAALFQIVRSQKPGDADFGNDREEPLRLALRAQDKRQLEKDILLASIALKLALRNFSND